MDKNELMFCYDVKRHTGGWCGPGQRLTASARVPICDIVGQVSGRSTRPCSLLLSHRPQGPGVVSGESIQMLVTSYSLPIAHTTCLVVDRVDATQT